MTAPLVSVIIPAYNAEKYLAETLESVLAQTLQEIEVIVVDDGSRDGTARIAQGFPRVRYVHQANGGVSSARNHAAALSTGEFLAFLDSDDIWHPDKLRQQVEAFRLHPDSAFSRTEFTCDPVSWESLPAQLPDSTPRHSIIPELSTSFLAPYFTTSTVMVRRTAYEEANGFDASLRIAEDVDFYLRVLARHPKLILMSEQLVYKRPVAGSLGDDSVAGYIQLLQVYDRFLAQNPQAKEALGDANVAHAYHALHLALARSHLWSGNNLAACQAAVKAMEHGPASDAWILIFKSLIPKSVRQALQRLRPTPQ